MSVSLINGHIDREELFIKSEIKNPVLKQFLDVLENKYGCLLNNMGCTTENGGWLSVKAITVLISEFDKELTKGGTE